MQDSLFPETPAPEPAPKEKPKPEKVAKAGTGVAPARHAQELYDLAAALPPSLRLGGSSWGYPGWHGHVWDREYAADKLSRQGLAAYAKHPLLRAVSIDRTFYQPLDALRLQQYALQVGDDFRFTIKAPALITDSMLRNEEGQGQRRNPYFLDAAHATQVFLDPVMQGMGSKLGAAVFQFSPLPLYWHERMPELIDRLHTFLRALPSIREQCPNGVIAVEVRDRAWLTPQFTQALKDAGATYCLGLHGKMPKLSEQLPILRALWPGPLVCRWNYNAMHGPYGYEAAEQKYEPFDKLIDPDLETRHELARVINGVTSAGQNALVTISNQAEGCAPLSIIELANAVIAQCKGF